MKFISYSRYFGDSPPVQTASLEMQDLHAKRVMQWLDLTSTLQDLKGIEIQKFQDILNEAHTSAKCLFAAGDDISAWVGQLKISRAAGIICPGKIAARQLISAAQLSVYLHLPEYADKLLERALSQDPDMGLPMQAHFCSIKGLMKRLQRDWTEAIPLFQKSHDKLNECSPREVRFYYENHRENLMANRMIHIADCYINLGWESQGRERHRYAEKARSYLSHANLIPRMPLDKYMTELNFIEVNLLDGNTEQARSMIWNLLNIPRSQLQQATIIRPGAYCMLARLADIEDNRKMMITHLSRAFEESTQSPHVLQELLVVDLSLELIRKHSLSSEDIEPLFKAMVSLLQAKDWYLGSDHSRSVAEITVELWKKWSPEENDDSVLEDLRWAGYLHDIGKLRLPRSLLNKIAPLCDKEWELIRRHPQYGFDILIKFNANRIAHWVLEHHQNLSGAGYPGDQLPSNQGLCLAVADFLDAATSSNRKYKKPKTRDEALAELRSFVPHYFPEDLINAAETISI